MSQRDRGFEWFIRRARMVLTRRFDAPFAEAIEASARTEYARLRPEVPDIGGTANVFQPVMTINGWIVALHRAMHARGKTAAETIAVCHAVFDGWLSKLPGWLLRAIGKLALTRPVRRYFERQAARSQERRYAKDFLWHVENGPNGEFSMVFDECAVNKWYEEQAVEELKPYCNFADITYSRLMGMGVDASQTIGLGCDRCALRFKGGRETAIPPTLQGIIPTR